MECFPFTSPEDEERLDLDLHSFLTLAQVSRPGRLICVGKATAPTEYESWWAPETFWTVWRREQFLPLLKFEPLIFQPLD